jgi:glycosyltransferase involved in cell wall biosynthesis
MPKASIIVPSFNVSSTIGDTLSALMDQTFCDFEVIIVDDGSIDDTQNAVAPFLSDARIRTIHQANRGLAGARNTGIAAARGDYIGFCDADDIWLPEKLALHVDHLDTAPTVGVSFSGSELIGDDGAPLGMSQNPRLRNISAAHIFKRNPIGNGSAPVIRRAVFDAIAYQSSCDATRISYFDETFRQSEDIECWLRIALTTDWAFEGVSGELTQYRVSRGGLSAATARQLIAWERMVAKLTPLDTAFFAKHAPAARAYQLRYLCRRALSDGDATTATDYWQKSIASSWAPLFEEPLKTCTTGAATLAMGVFGPQTFSSALTFLKRTRT